MTDSGVYLDSPRFGADADAAVWYRTERCWNCERPVSRRRGGWLLAWLRRG